MGFYQAVYAVGMFVGPFLAGSLNSLGGLTAGFYLAASIGAVAACFVFISYRFQKRKLAAASTVQGSARV